MTKQELGNFRIKFDVSTDLSVFDRKKLNISKFYNDFETYRTQMCVVFYWDECPDIEFFEKYNSNDVNLSRKINHNDKIDLFYNVISQNGIPEKGMLGGMIVWKVKDGDIEKIKAAL